MMRSNHALGVALVAEDVVGDLVNLLLERDGLQPTYPPAPWEEAEPSD
jgi:hypothetical protein